MALRLQLKGLFSTYSKKKTLSQQLLSEIGKREQSIDFFQRNGSGVE